MYEGAETVRGGLWVVIMWAVGARPFAIPDASWVAVAPRSGHTGWCVRHRVWGDILCMRVFMDVCTDNLIRATDTVIPTNPTPPLRLLEPLYIHVRPYIPYSSGAPYTCST